jgi:hypothetical protein
MTCNLSEGALYILNILKTHHCLARNKSYNSEKLSSIFPKRFPSSDFEETIREILGLYITQIPKGDLKYYISDIPKTSVALEKHGYTFTKGRVRPLKW